METIIRVLFIFTLMFPLLSSKFESIVSSYSPEKYREAWVSFINTEDIDIDLEAFLTYQVIWNTYPSISARAVAMQQLMGLRLVNVEKGLSFKSKLSGETLLGLGAVINASQLAWKGFAKINSINSEATEVEVLTAVASLVLKLLVECNDG